MKYEQFYLLYYKIKKNIFLNKKLLVNIDQLDYFEKTGLLLKKDNDYIYVLNNEKINDFDIQFLYNNISKLNFIFHENNLVKFLINYIIKNINLYLSIDSLILIIKKSFGEKYYLFEFDESIIIEAHKILFESGIYKKKYCFQNRIIVELGNSININNKWYFEIEECDFYQKILNYRLLSKI